MIKIYVKVETVYQRIAIHSINDKIVTFEVNSMVDFKQVLAKNKAKQGTKTAVVQETPAKTGANNLATLDETGTARVGFSLEESISGPSGTFSSVRIRVDLSVQCAQNEAEIRKATDILYRESAHLVDHYANPAMQLLIEHIERHK